MCICDKTYFWLVRKMYSFQILLTMIIFDMMEVSSIKLVTIVIFGAKFHSAGRIDYQSAPNVKRASKLKQRVS